jgi:hypothetical protein
MRKERQEGVIRELYFRADRREAVLLLECPDEAYARATLPSLPLVRGGLITFEMIPLAPYDGFARLFKSALGRTGREGWSLTRRGTAKRKFQFTSFGSSDKLRPTLSN